MDKRLFIPIVVIVLGSVLLATGMFNYPAESVYGDSISDGCDASTEDAEFVYQSSTDPSPDHSEEQDDSSDAEETTSASGMMLGGGGFPSAPQSNESNNDEANESNNDEANESNNDEANESNNDEANDGNNDEANESNNDEANDGNNDEANGSNNNEANDGNNDEANDSSVDDKEMIDPSVQEIPEFPTIALPMLAIIGLAFFFRRKQ